MTTEPPPRDAASTPLPHHIAIIMDGNGRWAEKRGLPRFEGHLAGLERARHTIRYLAQRNLEYLTLFGFSTENWNRPDAEVDGIMTIFAKIIDQEAQEFHQLGIRLHHLGRLEALTAGLRESIVKAIVLTKDNTGLTFNLAFNYGGRTEILDAARAIVAAKLLPEAIDETTFARYLYTAGMPDVDLLIRTGGELRLSNFLPWQSVYSEYYFSDALWPDFDEKELDEAVATYQRRHRRFGGL
jgi:undecaprenyl diphosphate synthase